MSSSRIARIATLLVVVVELAASACLTPSIPIPPPDPELMNFEIDSTLGEGRFSYPATGNYERAVVYVFNRRAGSGIITTAAADGSVAPTSPFPAALGDQVVITFEQDNDAVATCIRLRQGHQSAVDYCDP